MKKIIIILAIAIVFLFAKGVSAEEPRVYHYKQMYNEKTVSFHNDIYEYKTSFNLNTKYSNDSLYLTIGNYYNKNSFDTLIYISYVVNDITYEEYFSTSDLYIGVGLKAYGSIRTRNDFQFMDNGYSICIVFDMIPNNVCVTQYSNIEVELNDYDYGYIISDKDEYFINSLRIPVTGSNNYVLEPFDIEPPIITTKDEYTTSIDDPILANDVLNNATAYDSISGNLTDKLFIYDTNYSGKSVGDFYITLCAIDEYDNRALKDVCIHVLDLTKPVIKGENYYEAGINNYLNVDVIFDNLIIEDNYSKVFTHKIIDEYTNNRKEIGEHKVTYIVKDEALNKSEFEVIINVYDDIKPTIIGNNLFSYMSNPLTIDQIKEEISISDNYSNIDMINIEYETNYNINLIDDYYLKIKAIDEYNNEAIYEIIISVIDDIRPFFVTEDKIINELLNYEELLNYFNN